MVANDALHPQVDLQKQRLHHKHGTKTCTGGGQCSATRSACKLKIPGAWEDHAALHDMVRDSGEEATEDWGAKERGAVGDWLLELHKGMNRSAPLAVASLEDVSCREYSLWQI